jgi:hypothetical protein
MDAIVNTLVVLAAIAAAWLFLRRLKQPDGTYVLGHVAFTPLHAIAAVTLILSLYFAARADLPGILIVLLAGALTHMSSSIRKFFQGKKRGGRKPIPQTPESAMKAYFAFVFLTGMGNFLLPKWQEFLVEFIAEMTIWLLFAFILGTVHVLRKGKPPKGGFWAGVSANISSSGSGGFGGGGSGGGGAGR